MVGVFGSLFRLWPSADGVMPRHSGEAGIALGPILFVLAILVILAAAIAAGAGGFTVNTNTDSAKVMAHSILEQAEQIKTAVQRVQAHSCDDNQISFENPIINLYSNSNAPTDHSCHVFDPNGGGTIYNAPSKSALVSSTVYQTAAGNLNGYGQWVFSGWFAFYGIGSSCSNNSACVDLSAHVQGVTDDVCAQINKILFGNETIPTYEAWSWSPSGANFFTGTYNSGWAASYPTMTPHTFLSGAQMGCYHISYRSPLNMFFVILLAR